MMLSSSSRIGAGINLCVNIKMNITLNMGSVKAPADSRQHGRLAIGATKADGDLSRLARVGGRGKAQVIAG
jgi:hypothetical protein